MASATARLRKDFLSELPAEVLCVIAAHARPCDIAALVRASSGLAWLATAAIAPCLALWRAPLCAVRPLADVDGPEAPAAPAFLHQPLAVEARLDRLLPTADLLELRAAGSLAAALRGGWRLQRAALCAAAVAYEYPVLWCVERVERGCVTAACMVFSVDAERPWEDASRRAAAERWRGFAVRRSALYLAGLQDVARRAPADCAWLVDEFIARAQPALLNGGGGWSGDVEGVRRAFELFRVCLVLLSDGDSRAALGVVLPPPLGAPGSRAAAR